MQWEITFKKSLNNLFHSKEDETYYYILSLICSPVKGSEAFINLSSPSKTLDGGKELEKEMLSPKEKTPRGQLDDVLPDAPPAPRDHRPRSSEVTMLPPTEEEPRRSSRKVYNNGVKVISLYFGARIFLVSHCVLVVNFLLINI